MKLIEFIMAMLVTLCVAGLLVHTFFIESPIKAVALSAFAILFLGTLRLTYAMFKEWRAEQW